MADSNIEPYVYLDRFLSLWLDRCRDDDPEDEDRREPPCLDPLELRGDLDLDFEL